MIALKYYCFGAFLPYSKSRRVMTPNKLQLLVLVSPSGWLRCIPTAATQQCGEEIGSRVSELVDRFEETCDYSQKWQRGKLLCC